jgi:two-component sensor histidine kinase
MRSSERFPAVGESVVKARRFVTDSIVHVPRDISDALLVIASELATNCIRHGATTFEIRIDQLPDRILIEAEDDGTGDPVVRSPAPTDTSGRGLQIVKALANSWGVVKGQSSRGKTVWAILAVPASPENAVETSEATNPSVSVTPSGKHILRAAQALLSRRIYPVFA